MPRRARTVDANTIYFIYDFDGKLIAEAALDGSITVEYLYRDIRDVLQNIS